MCIHIYICIPYTYIYIYREREVRRGDEPRLHHDARAAAVRADHVPVAVALVARQGGVARRDLAPEDRAAHVA